MVDFGKALLEQRKGSTRRIRREDAMKRKWVSLDYETYSSAQLTGPRSVGGWGYSMHNSTDVLMVAWNPQGRGTIHTDLSKEDFPRELEDLLCDERVEKWAFNAAFERLITMNTLCLPTPIKGWRCTMALANLQSFTGTLFDIGVAMGMDSTKLKSKEGSRLIKLFCMPQRLTKKNYLPRRHDESDPEDWELFCRYNIQDNIAEDAMREKLLGFYVPHDEWELYELDQKINDAGLPVDIEFVRNADSMSNVRKAELAIEMHELTLLANPNSTRQLLPWLHDRGYGFDDLQKATVSKELSRNKEEHHLSPEANSALKMRQQISRTSVRKYPALMHRTSEDGRLRHAFQFCGAARTGRWAGRGPQPHNLTRTPKIMEKVFALTAVAETIKAGNYEDLKMLVAEPMTALAGSVRSSFQAPDGYEFVVCDLSAIESAVVGWLSGCKELLKVFTDKLDPYKSFGTHLYNIPYDQITGAQRSICKPAVLGCAYQLGGGTLKLGKKTGLWGYAENMGVNMAKEEAKAHVAKFREVYSEIPQLWYDYDAAARIATVQGRPTVVNNKVKFDVEGPYMTVTLPSGRPLYYYKPMIQTKEFEGEDGSTFTRRVVSYMGKQQNGRLWQRIGTSGGKLTENLTQAVARDVLKVGMQRAEAEGFNIVGSVHDEIIALTRIGDNRLRLPLLRECMMAAIPWADGLPLGAAGYEGKIYRKD